MIRPPADAAQRERLRTEFDTTFFVEAGAGTGKTTEVVARIVALVAAGQVRARELVAITFSEAAAGELRARIREGLEDGARGAATPEERERCAAAARDITEAAIDTIHAFAGALLRTYPLEAGLPPNFEMLDEIRQAEELDERFRAYFDDLGRGLERDLARRALLLGLTPDLLRALWGALHEHYDLLTAGEPWPAADGPLDAVATGRELARRLAALAEQLTPALAGERIAQTVTGLGFAVERLRDARDDDSALAALRAVEHIDNKNAGNRQDWERLARGGGALLAELKRELPAIEERACEVLGSHRRDVLTRLLGSLRRAVLGAADARKHEGVATFHDLLTWSRDLLRDDLEVRRRAHGRWSRIFIDEFQDTDPLQAELAFYLASAPGSTGDWRALPLVPGKLCLVGDPKQSIYRFRRADIALYQAIEQRIGLTVELTQNFRSVPRILDFVNAHYGVHMQRAEGVQPVYIPLAAEPHDTGQGVWRFGEPLDKAQPEVWDAEAKAVARSARRVVADGWAVSDEKGAARHPRPAEYRDIAVLIPARTNLRRLERAFAAEGVPYRIESGELIVQTQEVRDLVSCLRAVDDPSDQVALVAALRSVAYGVSDVELLRWSESGGRWSYEYPGDGAVERVRLALAELHELHVGRHRLSVPAVIQEILDRRMLVAGAFAETRPRESWRRYRYVLDRARAFEAAGHPTLRGFVDWIESLQDEQRRDVSPALTEDDEDAVRVLTVHGSKGREFPVVILTGWGSSRPSSTGPIVVDRVRDQVQVGLGARDDGERTWTTQGFTAAEADERARGDAEGIRLSYVAATRARDHLIVSLYRRATERKAQAVALAATLEEAALAQEIELTPLPEEAPAAGAHSAEDAGAHAQVEERWLTVREALVAERSGLTLITATGLKAAAPEQTEEPERPNPPRFPRGRGGTALGRAVHAVLQVVDLGTLSEVGEISRAQAAAEGIPGRAAEVERLVRAACATEPIRRAVSSGRYWREVPVGAALDGVTLEGFIDLLYESDGLAIVDYKTDDVSGAELDRRFTEYSAQGGAYVLLAESALRRSIARVEFVFVRAGVLRSIDDLDAARAHARSLVVAAGRRA